MNRAKVHQNFLHIFMIALFVLLIIYFPRLKNFEDYFIYAATILVSLHFWYGALVFIKTLGPATKIYEFLMDISILALKIVSIYTIIFMHLWLLVNGILMSLVVLKYNLASRREHPEKNKKYISKKISIERLAILSLFILAFLTWKIDLALFKRAVSVAILGVQILTICWIVLKEKVYDIIRK